jgi:membrane protein DedA with SNARE-associated domain
MHRSWRGDPVTLLVGDTHRSSGYLIVASRFVPVVRVGVPAVLGWKRMSLRRFLAWFAVANVLWAAVFVSTCVAAGQLLRRPTGSTLLTAGFGAIGLLIFVIGLTTRAILRNKQRGSISATPPEDDNPSIE